MLERLRSAVEGVAWPSLPDSAGSAMLTVQYQLEQSQWLDAAALWALQRRQLRLLLEHAVRTVPFYRERLASALSRLPEEFTPGEYATLPRLTRRDLQTESVRLRSEQVHSAHGRVFGGATSGSTGEPVRFANTDLCSFFWQAINLRDHLWHCRDFGATTAAIRMGGKAIREDNWFGAVGRSLMDTGPLVIMPSETTIDEQLDMLIEAQPAHVNGFANNIRELARASIRRNLCIDSLREARSFGEQIGDEHRQLCQQAWNVPLTDIYTTREAGYLALQCPSGTHYHVQSETALVEVLDANDRLCRPGEQGRVVVTVLHNFATPLIRYELGDFAEVGQPCACGRGLPVLTRILGRSRNMLRLKDGGMRWPAIGTAEFLDAAPIRQFRFEQINFDLLEAHLVTERPLTSVEEQRIAGIVTSHLGVPFRVIFVYHETVMASASGKLEDFVSELT